MTAPARLRHFIAGQWRSSDSDRWIDDVNPAAREFHTEIKTVQLNA